MNTTATLPSIVLTPDELQALTGFTQASKQLAELRRQGFWRARQGRAGVLVERAHYEAVCRGQDREASAPPAPRVHVPKVRSRARTGAAAAR